MQITHTSPSEQTRPATRAQALATRAAAIRLPQSVIASEAGLDGDTVSRVFTGRVDPLSSTLDKIERVIAAHEVRLRDELIARHPLEAASVAREAQP